MKKILTFLVMLFVTVSVAVAQTGTIVPIENLPAINEPTTNGPTADVTNPIKFNYQAVVRDQNSKNLVNNETLTVKITITENGVKAYEETKEVTTTLNGMVSFEIGANPGLDTIDWSNNVIIAAQFLRTGVEIALVETPVMAVPYAIQAKNAPVELTTKEICRYLSTCKTTAVDSVFDALVNNNNINQYLKDTIIGYVKTQKPLLKDLALYFLGLVDRQDVKDALDAVSTDVKEAVRDSVISYIKNHKDLAMQVLVSYIGQVTKEDVGDILSAIEENDESGEIRDTLAKYAFNYIIAHKPLVWKVYTTIVDSVKAQDFDQAYEYFKTAQNGALYQYFLGKFDAHLNNYLTENLYLRGVCTPDTIREICSLLERIKTLENSVDNTTPSTPTANCITFGEVTFQDGTFTCSVSGWSEATAANVALVASVKFYYGTEVVRTQTPTIVFNNNHTSASWTGDFTETTYLYDSFQGFLTPTLTSEASDCVGITKEVSSAVQE
jgi:hypothetical protein